jgi:hypothetical protein
MIMKGIPLCSYKTLLRRTIIACQKQSSLYIRSKSDRCSWFYDRNVLIEISWSRVTQCSDNGGQMGGAEPSLGRSTVHGAAF